MVELDVKDRRIIYHLSQNARVSTTHLAKEVGLSKSTTAYRVQRLRQSGVITQFSCLINLKSLSLETFALLLKFNDDLYENPARIEHFRDHKYTNWVASLSGEWDLLVEFVCRDLGHLNDIVYEVLAKFGDRLATYRLLLTSEVIKVEHLVADLYKDLGLEPPRIEQRARSRSTVDDTDLRILEALTQDSSQPYLRIGAGVGASLDTVRLRMRRLSEEGVLLKCFAEVSLRNLGYTEYVCVLSLRSPSRERLESLQGFLRGESSVTYAFLDTASFSIAFVCAFKTSDGVDHLLRTIRKLHGQILERQEFLLIREQVKFDLFPSGYVP